MSILNRYFNQVFVISLTGSLDRKAHCRDECLKHSIDFEWFRAHDFRAYQAMPESIRKAMDNAMYGCTASHGGVLNLIGHAGYDKALVLEDDFEIFHDDFNERFEALIPFIPPDWDILYLGAGYVNEDPIIRINEHIIKVGRMKTTSSYAIRAKHARFMAPLMAGGSAPDDVLSGVNPFVNAYCVAPRLMGQFENVSTIFGKLTNNSLSMADTTHERTV